jgi:hypothetical protein
VLLEGDEVAHARWLERWHQPHLGQGRGRPAERGRPGFEGGGQLRRTGLSTVTPAGKAWTSSEATPACTVPPCSWVARRINRRGHEQALVGVVERAGGDELVHRIGRAPLVGYLGLDEVVEVRVPVVLVDQLQLGGVLDGVAVRVEVTAGMAVLT